MSCSNVQPRRVVVARAPCSSGPEGEFATAARGVEGEPQETEAAAGGPLHGKDGESSLGETDPWFTLLSVLLN